MVLFHALTSGLDGVAEPHVPEALTAVSMKQAGMELEDSAHVPVITIHGQVVQAQGTSSPLPA